MKKTIKKSKSAVSKKSTKKVPQKNMGKAIKKTTDKKSAGQKVNLPMTEEMGLLGKAAPSFRAPDSTGKLVTSKDFSGKKVVLYFYPKDNTPGCTLESQQFSGLVNEFKKENAVILGVSKDSVKSHDNFKCKYHFEFELLADEDEKICNDFMVIKEKNMYGKKYMGIERSTFVIDEKGIVILEYRKVSPPGHAAQVLEDLKKWA